MNQALKRRTAALYGQLQNGPRLAAALRLALEQDGEALRELFDSTPPEHARAFSELSDALPPLALVAAVDWWRNRAAWAAAVGVAAQDGPDAPEWRERATRALQAAATTHAALCDACEAAGVDSGAVLRFAGIPDEDAALEPLIDAAERQALAELFSGVLR